MPVTYWCDLQSAQFDRDPAAQRVVLRRHTHWPKAAHTHQQPSRRASRWRTWLAVEGPEPSGTVMVVSLGNVCSDGTNVKVKGTPSKTWRERATNHQPSTYTHTHTHDFAMEDNWVKDLLTKNLLKIVKQSAVILLVFTLISESYYGFVQMCGKTELNSSLHHSGSVLSMEGPEVSTAAIFFAHNSIWHHHSRHTSRALACPVSDAIYNFVFSFLTFRLKTTTGLCLGV